MVCWIYYIYREKKPHEQIQWTAHMAMTHTAKSTRMKLCHEENDCRTVPAGTKIEWRRRPTKGRKG
jgi:hypothetical protein